MSNPVKLIWGSIGFSDDDPTILGGSKNQNNDCNFSVNRAEKGLYFVTFPNAFFDQVPSVMLTQIWNGGNTTATVPASSPYLGGSTLDNAVLVGVSETEFNLITGDEDGNLQD